ncbi:hypothetical protein FSP39_000205 [Pinctada imbricata]|uniref:Uncharacterized protein n=1 Tax=Pinctada imbricata TaxID=66713 RepID=A0AA88Y730_PINIB|nr:hypothetical protein FSP39_000205 [Pinctada imbricata]
MSQTDWQWHNICHINCITKSIFLKEVVLLHSHDAKEECKYNDYHQQSSVNQQDDTRSHQVLTQRSRPKEEKYEMSFNGDREPFEEGNSTRLFWGHFLHKISFSFNISKDNVKANDLFLGKPLRLTFTLLDPPDEIRFVKGVELMIKNGQFIISIPEAKSNYSAIAIKNVIGENLSVKTTKLSRMYVILIVFAASIFTVGLNIAICTRITRRKNNFRPNPAVKYSMKEVLKTWEKREKGKQSKEETLSRANTMEMTETFRPSERRQSGGQTRRTTKPPPIVVPVMKE